MKIEDRDKIDDLFRSKLYDFEPDALPDDVWEKIEGRLDTPRYTLYSARKWKQWLTVAAIALLALGSGFYFFQKEPVSVSPAIADKIEEKNQELKSLITDKEVVTPITDPIATVTPQEKQADRTLAAVRTTSLTAIADPIDKSAQENIISEEDVSLPETNTDSETEDLQDTSVINKNIQSEAVASPVTEQPETISKVKKTKRWGFGMGAGSVTAGSSDVANVYAFRNTTFENPQLDYLNSFMSKNQVEAPKTDIKHSQPVSFGLSASYMLAPRWYLQAGLNYSYLSSEWKTNGSYYAITKQRLHFVGLPISLAYKIAEWNSFMWYASAGFMPEVNVAGKLKETKYTDGLIMGESAKTSTRMKEWYWSVNAATGVSYPIFSFLSAFAEVGAGYYFDNGSSIETIHSDKPFNVNLSIGLRLGF